MTVVFRVCALGDFVVTTPVLRALERPLLVAHGEHGQLARATGLVDATIDADGAGVHPLYSEDADPARIAASLRERLESGSPALVFSRPGVARDRLVANLRRFGAREVDACDPLPPPGTHAVDHLWRAARLPGDAPDLALRVDAGPSGATLAIHPGAGSSAKRWPVERWATVLDALDTPLLYVEGPADAEVVDELKAIRPAPVLRGASVTELACVLAECRALLGHDSGVSHLAAALGIPTLALFGPSDPERWAPRGARVVRAPDDDLGALSVDAVLASALELLGAR